jgi:peroxiredoxin Q/BCP
MLATLAIALLLQASPAPPARPAVGAPAPDVELASTAGGTVTVSGFKGKQSVVLAFYPKAFTGG